MGIKSYIKSNTFQLKCYLLLIEFQFEINNHSNINDHFKLLVFYQYHF